MYESYACHCYPKASNHLCKKREYDKSLVKKCYKYYPKKSSRIKPSCRENIYFFEFLEQNKELPFEYLKKIWDLESVIIKGIEIKIPLLCCSCYANKSFDEAIKLKRNYFCYACDIYVTQPKCPLCKINLERNEYIWDLCPNCNEWIHIYISGKKTEYCDKCGFNIEKIEFKNDVNV